MAKKLIKLATISDIRREMATVYREARAKTIENTEAHKLTMMLKEISKAAEIELNFDKQPADDKKIADQLRDVAKAIRDTDTTN